MTPFSFVRRIQWEQFRRRTSTPLFPLAYYYRPYTLSPSTFPPVRVIAQTSSRIYQQTGLLEKKSFDRLQGWLVRRLLRDPSILTRQIEVSRRFADHWLAWCRSTLSTDRLRRLTTAELANHYRTFQKQYERYSLLNVFYWVFAGDRLIEALERELRTFIADDTTRQRVLVDLTTPESLSFLQAEECVLLKLALRTKQMTPRQLDLALVQHVERFGWIPWDYVGPTHWTKASVRIRLTRMIRSKRSRGQLKALGGYSRRVHHSIIAAERRWSLPGHVRRLATATRAQAILQDDKKATTTEAHYSLHFLHRETAQRLKAGWQSLYYASFDEIISALRGVPLPDSEERRRHGIIFIARGQFHPVEGVAAERWFKQMFPRETKIDSVIVGTPASHGSIRGRVAVVSTPRDVAKVRRGDILVTQMTSPAYVPAMRLAAAFVTDEGGLTCHAAIVAREMKKPCVIGTKVATRVLKDGDRVEVDAVRGIVQRL